MATNFASIIATFGSVSTKVCVIVVIVSSALKLHTFMFGWIVTSVLGCVVVVWPTVLSGHKEPLRSDLDSVSNFSKDPVGVV